MKRFLSITAVALMLAGCANEAADLGGPVPVHLSIRRVEVVAPPGARYSPGWLRQQAGLIADGDLQAVHAEIITARPQQAATVRGALIQAGLDPVRITASYPPRPSRRGPYIIFTRTRADTGDCRAAVDLSFPADPSRSLMNLGHCLKNNDLANMVVDPADLVAPPQLGRADGGYLAGAVRKWQNRGDIAGTPAAAGASSSPTAASSPSSTTGSGSPAAASP